MKYLILTVALFFSHSSMSWADVGCGPSPSREYYKSQDTADTGDEAQEEAKKSINRMDIALLFVPVIGLLAFSRREEKE